MASSKTEVCNLAIAHFGIGKLISNVDTDDSSEAKACKLFFDTALLAVLRDFAWPFATKFVSLGLIEEDPNDEWGFSYDFPTDCVLVRRILSGIRNDNRQEKVSYKIASADTGDRKIIYTDVEDAQCEYTFLLDSFEVCPSDFVLALSRYVAFLIAPSVARTDEQPKMLQMYEYDLKKAKASSANEEQPDEEADGSFVQARI